MKAALFWRQLRRESRGSRGRLLFFVSCLAVGVAAVVSVAALSSSLDSAIHHEARQLLAADLKVEARREPPAELEEFLATADGLRRTRLKEMVTVAVAGGSAEQAGPRSQLVELKAVEGSYPFYGNLELEPARPLSELLTPETVVVAPDLLARLRLQVGDELRLGGEPFRIVGQVLSEPDRMTFSLTLGPRVFLTMEGLERTRLEQFGSRISRTTLLAVPPDTPITELQDLAATIRDLLPDSSYFRVEIYTDAQPSLRQGLRRVERFLGLVALLSLLIGGIGVAQTVRAWLAGRLDAIAVLKCLGMRPREILALYLGQAVLLGLLGSVVGAALGLALPLAMPYILGSELVPPEAIQPWQPLALLRGLLLGTGIAALFSVPPLLTGVRVPPVRVLRRSAEPLPTRRAVAVGLAATLFVGIALTATVQSRSIPLGLAFAAGAAAAAGLLAAGAWVATRLVARLRQAATRQGRPHGRFWLRHGLAALARPGAGTLGSVVALGLGIMVVLAMSVVERHLVSQLDSELPEDAPSVFLVDIQPHQWDGVQAALAAEGAESVDSVPVVMGRLTAIDGQGVEDLVRDDPEAPRERSPEEGRERWALTREQRLSYMEELPEDNRIVEGALWSNPDMGELSVEKEFAEGLGVGVGSVLRFDIQGVPLELEVTSLRTVRWETFAINFFLVVEPGVLEDAPQFRIATARLPPAREQTLQDRLASEFPNVTVLRIREILEKVLGVLERLSFGVRVLGSFTVLAGLAILGGAVSAGSARRGREVALLKTLGLTRGGIAATFTAEYALVGLVAGLIGTAAGLVLAWAVLTHGMEIAWTFYPLPTLLALAASIALTVLAGLAASARAMARRPVEVLRGEE